MFDIDAWLDEAAPPQRSVTVYGRGDLVSQLQDVLSQDEPAPVDLRLGGSVSIDEAEMLRQQIEESALVLHVRGPLDDERYALVEKYTTGEGNDRKVDEVAHEVACVAAFTVEPSFTTGQADALRKRIGQAQWDSILAAMTKAMGETIDVPLSRLGSGTAQDS